MSESNVERFLQAIKAGDLKLVKKLAAQSPELLDQKPPEGISTIMLALYHNETEIAVWLEKQGIPLGIHDAAALGNLKVLSEMLQNEHGAVNTFSPDGFQPLGLACFFNHTEAVKFLLDNGAGVNTPSQNKQMVTPLHSAAAANSTVICRLLIEKGANANSVQQGGFTALHAAAQNGNLDLSKLLIEAGADVTAKTAQGQTALDFSLKNGSTFLSQYLSEMSTGN